MGTQYKNIIISDNKAIEFYADIMSEVNARMGRKPCRKEDMPQQAVLNGFINEYRKVYAQGKEYLQKYRVAKISSMICKEFPSIGI